MCSNCCGGTTGHLLSEKLVGGRAVILSKWVMRPSMPWIGDLLRLASLLSCSRGCLVLKSLVGVYRLRWCEDEKEFN